MLRKKLKLDINSSTETNKKSDSNVDETNQNPQTESLITSQYFIKPFWHRLFQIECELNDELKDLKFSSPVAAVYNPLIYAVELHSAYLKKFLDGPKEVILIGMNPGPWGMCQTGVFSHKRSLIRFKPKLLCLFIYSRSHSATFQLLEIG